MCVCVCVPNLCACVCVSVNLCVLASAGKRERARARPYTTRTMAVGWMNCVPKIDRRSRTLDRAHARTVHGRNTHRTLPSTRPGSQVARSAHGMPAGTLAAPQPPAYVGVTAVRGSGRTRAQRLRVNVGGAGRVQVKVEGAPECDPVAAGRQPRRGHSAAVRHVCDVGHNATHIRGIQPKIACGRAVIAGAAAERERCRHKILCVTYTVGRSARVRVAAHQMCFPAEIHN